MTEHDDKVVLVLYFLTERVISMGTKRPKKKKTKDKMQLLFCRVGKCKGPEIAKTVLKRRTKLED